MDFKLNTGTYKSIKSLDWKNIPKFVVITGKNGSGKTQLLELINFHFSTPKTTLSTIKVDPKNPFYGIETSAEGFNIKNKEVVYLPSVWNLNLQPSSATNFNQVIGKILNQIKGPGGEQNYEELARVIEHKIGKPKNKVTITDVQDNLPIDYYDYINKINIHEGLSEVFRTYQLKNAELRDSLKSKEQIEIEIGEAPWEIINNLLKNANFPYRVCPPISYIGEYHFKLVNHKDSSIIINFSDLSSGEKVLISMVFWMFNSGTKKRLPKLLLLDEPDAHLHPSAVKGFINVLENVLVNMHDVRVIITTHSPSTVSFSPEYSLFEMSNDSPQIKPLISQQYGINLLTDGLIVIKPNTRYVLVEDYNDSKYYNEVFKILKNKNKIKKDIDIIFISASNKKAKTSGGCTVVRGWVEKFISEGVNDVFQGLIDLDNGTNTPETITPSKHLHVVSRYSLENYLLDPILIYSSLLHENIIPTIPGISLTQKDEHKIDNLSKAKLQIIVNYIFNEIEPLISGLTPADKTLVDVSFITRKKLKYPKWFLSKRGHDLYQKFAYKYNKAIGYDKLIDTMIRREFIPVDLVETFKELQK